LRRRRTLGAPDATQRRHHEQSTGTADRELKAKHRTMWALGDYPSVVSGLVADLGPVLVEASGSTRGDRVLDVAAGSGNASLPAAEVIAEVIASDLRPALLEAGPSRGGGPGAGSLGRSTVTHRGPVRHGG